MTAYFTGDIHGNPIERFGYKRNPWMRSLTQDDYIFVLGDCGIPWFNPELKFYDYWTQPGSEKEDIYKLEWLSNRPEKYIFIRGNHDNFDLIKKMPFTNLGHARVRQMTYLEKQYSNIFYIDTPQFLYLQGIKYLIIPGAETHDSDVFFDALDPFIKIDIKEYERKCQLKGELPFYRVNHFSWWKDESVDKEKLEKVLKHSPNEIDIILSHAPRAAVHKQWKPSWASARLKPSKSELILEEVSKKINYKVWLHGHLHEYIQLDNLSSLGIYNSIFSLNEIYQIMKVD